MSYKEYTVRDVSSHIKPHRLEKIQYSKKTKTGEEISERDIIPVNVPSPTVLNVKAIDVTGLSEEEQNDILSLMQEYQEYIERQKKTLFDFKDFVQHTHNREAPELKWRAFKTTGLKC